VRISGGERCTKKRHFVEEPDDKGPGKRIHKIIHRIFTRAVERKGRETS
jgi:hypothetical protein